MFERTHSRKIVYPLKTKAVNQILKPKSITMKNYVVSMALLAMLFSIGCNAGADATALANEVCDCRMKTKGMKMQDPERKKIWLECSKIQGENFAKISKDKPAEEAYNKRLNECLQEVMNAMPK